MTWTAWILYGLTALLALVVAVGTYRWREAPSRGRGLLATLRSLSLALVVLLLFDPHLPAGGGVTSHRTLVLLDRSLSMLLPAEAGAPQGATRWQRAVEVARDAAGRTGTILLFGGVPRPVPADSLAGLRPAAPESRLLPALQAASEAGAGRVVVVTDGGVQDAAQVARWLPRLGLTLQVRRVTGLPPPDFALADVSAPAWAQAGKPLRLTAALSVTGNPGDSATVVVRQDGRVLGQRTVAAPSAGRSTPVPFTLTAASPATAGFVRYDVAVLAHDAVPEDDERSVYVYVSEQPAGIALVSFHPDWEPRFLQPVLATALGLPTRGFLMVAPGRYVTMGTGLASAQPVAEDRVREAVAQADVVVLHGIGADAPAWALRAARTAPRVLLFPLGTVPDLGLPFTLPPAIPGDWYASARVPASPVAPLLAGIDVTALPPLGALRPLGIGRGEWAALNATRGRNGPPSPLAVGGSSAGRRWVVALGEGFWQWAFRGGNAADLYRRLWGSLGGWLIQERRPLAGAAIRPVPRVVPRGTTVRWVAAGLAADSLAVRVSTEAGAAVIDTVLPLTRGDTAIMHPLAPGQYRYAARAFSGGRATATAAGPFTVARFSPDFLRPLLPLSAFTAATRVGPGAGAVPGIPLHTLPWPYLLLVALLVGEWVLRRRWGLR